MSPQTLIDEATAFRIAALPLQYRQSQIKQLFARGYERYVVDGEEQPEELLDDIERFGTAAFREQVRIDAADNPFVDEPGTLAVLATLSAVCVKQHPKFEQTPAKNIQVLYDIRELYVNNLGSLVRVHGDQSLQQDIAEVLYSKEPGEDGPHPGRVCSGITKMEEFGGGQYIEIPMPAASRKCLVRAGDADSSTTSNNGEILTRVQDNHLYVPLFDFDDKYREYADKAFKKLLSTQEEELSEDQLTWLNNNESAITKRIDRFVNTGNRERLWRNWDRGERIVRVLRRAIDDAPDVVAQLGEFHTAEELFAAIEAYDSEDWERSITAWISSPRSLGATLAENESHYAVTINRDDRVHEYRIAEAGRGVDQIQVEQIEDLFELPCMANMEERLHEKKPVRKDLYNFARMVMWLPQYQGSSIDTIVEDLKEVFSRWPWYDEEVTEYQVRYEFDNDIEGETPLPMNCDNPDMQRYCIGQEQCPYSIWGSVPFPEEMYEQAGSGPDTDSHPF